MQLVLGASLDSSLAARGAVVFGMEIGADELAEVSEGVHQGVPISAPSTVGLHGTCGGGGRGAGIGILDCGACIGILDFVLAFAGGARAPGKCFAGGTPAPGNCAHAAPGGFGTCRVFAAILRSTISIPLNLAVFTIWKMPLLASTSDTADPGGTLSG